MINWPYVSRQVVRFLVFPLMWPAEVAVYLLCYRDYGLPGLRIALVDREVPAYIWYFALSVLPFYWIAIILGSIYVLVR